MSVVAVTGVAAALGAGFPSTPVGRAALAGLVLGFACGFAARRWARCGRPRSTAELHRLREASARSVSAGDAERRRIERDLHDGAQQQLVALALDLRAAQRTLADGGDHEVDRVLEDAVARLRGAVEELRRLARGVHPAILTEAGLAAALHSVADQALPRVTITGTPALRLPQEVETAAYYVACEAVANAAKHASATAVTINARQCGDTLTITVTDDGVGGANTDGPGLRGLADRVQALGGRLQIHSPDGHGTRLTAEIPYASETPTTARARLRRPADGLFRRPVTGRCEPTPIFRP